MTRPHDAQSRAQPRRREAPDPESGEDATARTLLGIAIAAAVLLLLWIAGHVLLVIFAGILLGILLFGVSHWLSTHSFLSYGWALVLVTVAAVIVIGLGGWLLAPRVTAQLSQLQQEIATPGDTVRQFLSQYGWGRALLDGWSPAELTSNLGSLLKRMLGLASTLLGALGTAAIILFIGLYTAAEPGLYRQGILRLLPVRHRPRAAEVLRETAHTLRRWLIGRAVAMFAVAAMAAAGLWLLGIPLALTLGLLAGLLDFVPIIGPIVAGALALLIALAQGPTQGLYVVALYIGVQIIEGYLLTPLIQERTVSLPPALLIAMLVVMGVFFGIAGVALAAPLAAVGLVVTRMVYVEDVLGDRSEGGS